MLDGNHFLVLVTCFNTKEMMDIDQSIEGFYDSIADALDKIKELKTQECKNSGIYNTMLEYLQDTRNLNYERAVNYFNKKYVLTPMIINSSN